MHIQKNKFGLYEFDIKVKGKKKSKILKGLIDTGSTDCACTYHVITTLQIRPISFSIVSAINNEPKRSLIYLADVGFGSKSEPVKIIRVANLPQNIHFLLGMSILSKCHLNFNDEYLDISWKRK